jgi:glutamate/tyrosine decarboxylase-like PLP-dependent enzyme
MNEKRFPTHGWSRDRVMASLRSFKEDDIDWRHGRAPLYVFYADDEHHELLKDAYCEYFSENVLGAGKAFPSLARLEAEIIEMADDILNGGGKVDGSVTSGGSESIFLAIKTARDFARDKRPELGRPRMVLPETAHPIYYKAAHYMDLDVVQIPVRDDFRADMPAMAAAVDADTFLIVGSAPGFSHGVYDPIEELAALARDRDIWLHVDACVGGYIAPSVRRLGYAVPAHDFSVPGVTSISADLHKMGFAAKPASTILYADRKMMDFQRYSFSDWPRGVYDTPNITGTRPGGAIAAAWAILKYLGQDGYDRIAKTVMDTRQKLIDGVEAIDGLRMLGDPELNIVSYTSDVLDIYAVADMLGRHGWLVGCNRRPPAIQLMLTPVHGESMDEYLRNLDTAVNTVRKDNLVSPAPQPSY